MATLQRPGTGTTEPPTTATERAETGAETAREEGKGVGGQAVEAAKNVVTGRDEPGVPDAAVVDRSSGVVEPGVAASTSAISHHHHHDNGVLGRTEEEFAKLRTRTHITHEGEAYCPNPNIRDLPREYETRVTVIQRYPEMRKVEKTDFVKEISHEDRTITVPKTRIVMDEVEHIDRVPVVRQVPKKRIEIVYRVVTEEREVTEMVEEVEYIDVPRIEMVPRVITEDVEETVIVPVVREVAVTRTVEVPTGNYCEAPVGDFINPGHFNLIKGRKHRHKSKIHSGGLLHRSKSGSSEEENEEESKAAAVPVAEGETVAASAVRHHADGSTTVSPSPSKRKSLLQRIMH